ncbi:MAG: PAS domain-containing protein [Spirochaetes bacterium]|nr:PAS domain-containing protein [Spirochaetota bacterium]MBU0954403.1 PAS domain-containing protein [Spirochaetota bacterium]
MAEFLQNSETRAQVFRSLLDAMLAGSGTVELVRRQQRWLDDSTPTDLVQVVDAAVADNIAFEQLKPAVAKLINLMHTALLRHRHTPAADDLFFAALMAENEGLSRILTRGKFLAAAVNSGGLNSETIQQLSEFSSELSALEIHLCKKENILFPCFEKLYPEYRCVRLMWDIHDDIRQGLRQLNLLLDEAETAGGVPVFEDRGSENLVKLNKVLGKLYFDLNTNLFREEHALFPVMAPLLSTAVNHELFEEALGLGWAFANEAAVAALTGAQRQQKTASEILTTQGSQERPAAAFSERTGNLPHPVLSALLKTIHIDMTWVDEYDKVRWFSDSPKRIFPRSPAIIGRDVRNCHPGSSVDRVVSILEAFRNGRKDHEDFWLNMGPRFIHIEYFALRDGDGKYLGTLEVSEDLSHKRSLQGEKRLAD